MLLTKQDNILHKSWELPNTVAAVQKVSQEILDQVLLHGFDQDSVFGIHLALEESLVNAVKHGNQSNPEKKVYVECLITPEKLDISITDEGQGFNPSELPDPRCDRNLYKCSGRGVLLIRTYMDIVEYNDRGNCVHMVKYCRPSLEKKPSEKNCS